jgi:hypothetical protein
MVESSKLTKLTQSEQALLKHAQNNKNVEYYRNRSDNTERPWYSLTPYIDSEERRQNLKDHKYSGSDCGLAYVYFYNPVANKLVECLPKNIAPNTLTVLGFIHTLIPMVLMFVT